MGEVNGDFDGRLTVAVDNRHGDADSDERVHEWDFGLPNSDDITPLTQGLIPLGLLSAFNIKPEPHRTSGEVAQASEDTLSLIRGSNYKAFCDDDDESETKKQRRNDSPEDADSAAAEDGGSGGGDGGDGDGDGGDGGGGGGEKATKRQRLVWTPQLHKRFVDVVARLGIKNAVPKTIMQLMNVEGLTRENVASHLQKYRLYLKRMHGGSDGGSNSSSENNGNGNGNGSNGTGAMSVPVMPMAMMGMGMMGYPGFESQFNHKHNHNHNQNNNGSHNYNNGNNHNHHKFQYSNGNNGMMMMQTGNKYGNVMSYHHSQQIGPSEN